jgi:hypothetical protein
VKLSLYPDIFRVSKIILSSKGILQNQCDPIEIEIQMDFEGVTWVTVMTKFISWLLPYCNLLRIESTVLKLETI